jgi:hypothetical protein
MKSTSKNTIQKERLKTAIESGDSSVQKLIQKKPKNKYGAIVKEYNGVNYHSTKEADYAKKLDFLVKLKQVEKWERQITYKLIVEGVLICKYILDFKVYYTDGHVDFIDIKGQKKGQAYQMFVIKQKLMQAIYQIDVEVV